MKKLHLLFLPALLALAACSSSSPYERGAYTVRPPPASTFSPTEDAPHTTGQPGYVNGRRVERSPNKRYTAPSAEPQIMAADGDDRRTIELMLDEPVPEETPEGIPDVEYAKCWNDLRRMMKRDRDALLKFYPKEVQCLRNRVLAHCGGRQNEARAKKTGEKYDDTYEDFMASAPARKACGPNNEHWTDRVSEYIRKYTQHGDDILGWRP